MVTRRHPPRSRAALKAWASTLLVALLAGCGGTDNPIEDVYEEPAKPAASPRAAPEKKRPAARPAREATPDATATSPSGLAGKVKFKGAAGFSIKPIADGAKLVDAKEQEMARYTVKPDKRVKVKDATDKLLGQVRGSIAKLHVEGPDGERLFALQRQQDGDVKLETASGELLCKIKRRDYGWKIEAADGTETGKVKHKSGKTSLRDAADLTTLYTDDAIPSLSVTCLALDPLALPMRVALAIRIAMEAP